MEAIMLVLSRKKDEKILMKLGSEEVEVTVVRIDANKVRLGIKASEHVEILRSELLTKATEEAH
jgi:carbon storage regulator CsrA